MNRISFTYLILSISFPSVAIAHDFWIEPKPFVTQPKEQVKIHLYVGEKFAGEPVKPKADRVEEFVLLSRDGRKAIDLKLDDDPAGTVIPGSPGVHVVGFRNKPMFMELDADKFRAYLEEEGIGHIVAERAKRGESNKPGRELYSRAAKALIHIHGSAHGFDQELGFPAEFIPLRNPFIEHPHNEELPVLVKYEGKPLSDLTVTAMKKDDPKGVQTAMSDTEGRVVFNIAQPGTWMIKAVHMTREPEGSNAEWRSIWITLTFAVPGK